MTMKANNPYSQVTEELKALSALCTERGRIDPELYTRYDVKRGLRDIQGKGVVTGLTEISEIVSTKKEEGREVSTDGRLYYRGYAIEALIGGAPCLRGFEETLYLLLFGALPTEEELRRFCALLSAYRTLPTNFVRDIILKAPTADMMNSLERAVVTLYGYDDAAAGLSIPNVLRQCLQLATVLPLLSVYAYHAYNHYIGGESLVIHPPKPEYGIAENLLHCLRPDSRFTPMEARVLDLALMLHAEHGGGNNSTFTMHVVTSTGTDSYSAFAAALASLKGPKHGGANIMVVRMMRDLRDKVRDPHDENALRAYLADLLEKQGFDHSGLIYGMGHAIYSLSDPRAVLLRRFVKGLAEEKGLTEAWQYYDAVARLAPEVIRERRRIYKGVSPNVDFYSGFLYEMLDIPLELYTPLFAVAQMAGWSAHRIEELLGGGKIIRPAYQSVAPHKDYTKMEDR